MDWSTTLETPVHPGIVGGTSSSVHGRVRTSGHIWSTDTPPNTWGRGKWVGVGRLSQTSSRNVWTETPVVPVGTERGTGRTR